MAHFVYPTANPMAQVAPTAQSPYQSAQNAYVAAPQPTAYATAPAPRAGQAYESYPSASPAVHPTTQYTYTRAQVAVTPTVTYDQSKTYYQPSPSASYGASDHQFQGAKPVFSTGATYANAPRQTAVAAPKPQGMPASSSGTSYVYSSNTPAVTTYSTSGYTSTTAAAQSNMSGYDAALYSAASNYYSHQHPGKPGTASWMVRKTTGGGGGGGGPPFKPKPKGPPKSVQLHYCDVCKISCGGPQSYRDHLEGQKHKKKEAALKASQPASRGALQNQMRCELCDLTCTGKDSYAAHIRGAKHQKVVKLHTKLGKPIPSADPVVIPAETKAAKKSVVVQSATAAKKVLATPKINFVGGTQLKSTGSKAVEEKMDSSAAPGNDQSEAAASEDDAGEDVAPVGHEYIEEVVAESGKVISFSCKLCDCKFNDPYAKEIHLKGRRHRLQYKKKVDPNLLVKVKPKGGKQYQKEDYWRRQEMRDRKRDDMRMEDEIYWGHRRMEMMGGPMPPEFMDWHRFGPMGPMMRGPFPIPPMMRRPKSSDDKHVMAKHRDIYPTEEELRSVQSIVSSCERALKHVSDVLAESDAPADEAVKEETEKEDADAKMDEDSDKKDESSSNRVLKGVMRVGVLAKGLLLHGDLNVNLVVLCSEKPTRTMLERVADALPKQLANVAKDEYEVRRCVEEAAIIVSSSAEPPASCTITLTSPVMREANLSEGETVSTKDPPDVLDRQKCLDALAALRHAKWFQARANGLPSCVILIRTLRDLRRRVPGWAPLSEWAMELLVEKTVSTGSSTMGPGEALRRVFECIASGILLPGGPGLYDPCEKDAYDVTATLTSQQREDITALAQNAMRLIAFHQMHKVLDMELLPMPRFLQKILSNRKRRHTNSTEEDGGEKKDRKESESSTPASTTSTSTSSTKA